MTAAWDEIDFGIAFCAVLLACAAYATSRIKDYSDKPSLPIAQNFATFVCKPHFARVAALCSTVLVICMAVAVSSVYAVIKENSQSGLMAKAASRYEFEKGVSGLEETRAELQILLAKFTSGSTALANSETPSFAQMAKCEQFRRDQLKLELRVAELRTELISATSSSQVNDGVFFDKIKQAANEIEKIESTRSLLTADCRRLGRPTWDAHYGAKLER